MREAVWQAVVNELQGEKIDTSFRGHRHRHVRGEMRHGPGGSGEGRAR
jgi:hypothetical protein